VKKRREKILSSRSSNGEVRKDQLCSRCRNHGEKQLLRGHKNACPFTDCMCEKCKITMKRREIMAKQIKDYRLYRLSETTVSSPEVAKSPEIVQEFEKLSVDVEPFVEYEPMDNRDIFYMIQSLYEKYGTRNCEKKIQLIYAVAHLSKGNWSEIENALEKGSLYSRKYSVQHDLIAYQNNTLMNTQSLSLPTSPSVAVRVRPMDGNF